MYEMGSKYEFEVDVINDKIVAMFLINKVTYDYVNILDDSLENFYNSIKKKAFKPSFHYLIFFLFL